MKVQEHRYPAGSSLKRLRDAITKPFKRNAQDTERANASEAVDKTRQGKPNSA